MKIALFSRSIYPRPGGSSFVIENLAQNFLPTELVVIGEGTIGKGSKGYKRNNPVSFYYLPTGLSLMGRGARFFDVFRALLFPWALMKSVRLIKQHSCTHVLGVFPEGYYLWLSLLAARITGIPFSAYFHNTFVENRSGWRKWWGATIQGQVFKYAQHIFLMSEGMSRYYQEAYPVITKFKVLPHTFRHYPELENNNRPPSSPYQIAFTGNFNESNLEATIRIVNALKGNPQLELKFYTPVQKTLLGLRGVDVGAIRYKGYLPEENYFTELQRNDIMILTHGFEGGLSDIEYRTIFPTRTIQMMLTRKPILAHCPKGSFLHTFIKKYDCALLIDEKNPEAIAVGMERLLTDIEFRNGYIARADKAVAQFYGPNVYQLVRNTLENK